MIHSYLVCERWCVIKYDKVVRDIVVCERGVCVC